MSTPTESALSMVDQAIAQVRANAEDCDDRAIRYANANEAEAASYARGCATAYHATAVVMSVARDRVAEALAPLRGGETA